MTKQKEADSEGRLLPKYFKGARSQISAVEA